MPSCNCETYLETLASELDKNQLKTCFQNPQIFPSKVEGILKCNVCSEEKSAQIITNMFNVVNKLEYKLEVMTNFLQTSIENITLLNQTPRRPEIMRSRFIVSKVFLIFIKRFNLEEELSKIPAHE